MRKFIVGIGGTLRRGSSTETAIRKVLGHSAALGWETQLFAGEALDLPIYNPQATWLDPRAIQLIEALRRADAVILGSPGYHGSISGMVKNALDYTEAMSNDPRPYLEGRPVACIATASGWQGCNATLTALRSVVHALRGWPTPLGLALNTRVSPLDGSACAPEIELQISRMAHQLHAFDLVDSATMLLQPALNQA